MFFVQSYQIHAIPQNGFVQLYWMVLWYSVVLKNHIICFVKSPKMVGYAIIQRFCGVTWLLENWIVVSCMQLHALELVHFHKPPTGDMDVLSKPKCDDGLLFIQNKVAFSSFIFMC
jgi:hypothetical protein